MSESASNPYAAPQADLQPRRSLRQRFVDGAAWAWLMIFVINLPVPVTLGWGICSPEGRQGMLVTSALMLGISTWLVSTNSWFRVRMIIGGVCVAVTQFFPMLQFIAGIVGMSLLEFLALMPRRPPEIDPVPNLIPDLNLPSAIFLTLFVGFVLMLVALILGTLFRPRDSVESPAFHESETPS